MLNEVTMFFVGLLSGLIPGLHMNTVVLLVDASAAALVVAFVAHTLMEFIPSIFLAAPTEGTALAVLPGHRLLLKGQGMKALKLSLWGAVLGTLMFVLLAVPAYYLLPAVSSTLKQIMGPLLLLIVLYIIWTEREPRKMVLASVLFLLSGLVGTVVLDFPIPEDVKLFSLLTGAFGIATLVVSINSKTKIPPQIESFAVNSRDLVKPSLAGTVAGFLVGTIPAISTSQATYLLASIFDIESGEDFLTALGAVSVTNFLFSLITLDVLGKARNGTAHVIAGLNHNLLTLIGAALVTLFLALLFVLFVANRMLPLLRRLPYSTLNKTVLFFLAAVLFLVGGPLDLLIAGTTTALGVAANYSGVKRVHLMGLLLLPTIIFYLGL